MPDDLRQHLVGLYADLAAHTESECATNCMRPLSCCKEMYCALAVDFAREHWGIELQPTWHRELPLMGPDGCTAAPHLRPICTAHTCDISEFACKRGDAGWTARYYELTEAITKIEAEIFPLVRV